MSQNVRKMCENVRIMSEKCLRNVRKFPKNVPNGDIKNVRESSGKCPKNVPECPKNVRKKFRKCPEMSKICPKKGPKNFRKILKNVPKLSEEFRKKSEYA